ncbi:hypothetical protein F0562_014676 [Nyssa sinensis]|uniref:Nucleotide-diphospho-sugar transferase domain-containing protein n=1 Tax=Nyssa sinensis TaxID=561372 RepID=A0A5J4ZPJ3_9ASTE|nr:hypothetical protein F0562_014676 [Nyssa sinensis]
MLDIVRDIQINAMNSAKKNDFGNLTILCLLLPGFIYLCFWSPVAISKPFVSIQNYHPYAKSNTLQTLNVSKDELEEALDEASMENKTLIIAVVNKAYVEQRDDRYPTMLDLFLESFWVGEETRSLLDHLLIVAVDQTAYDRCKFRRLHCYRLVTDGVDFKGEKLYMSDDFIKMMWRRTLFLSDVLKRGYNFIFTDADIMWLRNPFAKLSKNESEDLQISTDVFEGNPWSEQTLINTGFYYIQSNSKTISLFEMWHAMKSNSTGMKEQDVLASLMKKGVFRELGLRVRFLDTLYFSGFCSDSRDVSAVTTVHANCCRSISAKVADLMAVLRDWRKYKAVVGSWKKYIGSSKASKAMHAANETFRWSNHIACFKSWRVPDKTLG